MTKKLPSNSILQIAVPTPLNKCFDYLPPIGFNGELKPGIRVLVPFGRRKLVGIIIDSVNQSQINPIKLKPIESVIDTTPIFNKELFELASWMHNYYHFPIGETFTTLLPSLLRQGANAETDSSTLWKATEQAKQFDLNGLNRSPVQTSILKELLNQESGLNAQQLQAQHTSWRRAIKALCDKQLVEAIKLINQPSLNSPTPMETPNLSDDQSEAISKISSFLDQFQTCLLDGVTGSGKTEVYIQLIELILAKKQQILVLIPEIGLSPQLLTRFKQRLKARIAVLHSGLNDRERLNTWLYAKRGELDIIIGTRSAVFTPLANPGLIIIDEEHDSSFKQQEGLRYHARDIAIIRGKKLNIPVVLGSATPSLESLNNALQSRYQHAVLPERVGDAIHPRFAVIDMRKAAVNQAFSQSLIEAMRKHLEKGQQVLLFLNRRGYSHTLVCHACGWTSACTRCDAYMTYYQKRRRLQCHHCGSERPAIGTCPDCHSENLSALGSGTERIEEQLHNLFKDKTLVRIDRDTTRRKGELEKALAQAQTGAADILLGTQMLAKGHHFPNVTLVGILDIDQGLFSADFRGPEYMAQLIIQVAGRAGRAQTQSGTNGEVLIQTLQPEHPLLKTLITQGYPAFARQALQERASAQLPPYHYMALLRVESHLSEKGMGLLAQIKQRLSQSNIENNAILGPAPAPMEKRAGRFRAHLLFQSPTRGQLNQLLTKLQSLLADTPKTKQVRWSIDVDPMEMF